LPLAKSAYATNGYHTLLVADKSAVAATPFEPQAYWAHHGYSIAAAAGEVVLDVMAIATKGMSAENNLIMTASHVGCEAEANAIVAEVAGPAGRLDLRAVPQLISRYLPRRYQNDFSIAFCFFDDDCFEAS